MISYIFNEKVGIEINLMCKYGLTPKNDFVIKNDLEHNRYGIFTAVLCEDGVDSKEYMDTLINSNIEFEYESDYYLKVNNEYYIGTDCMSGLHFNNECKRPEGFTIRTESPTLKEAYYLKNTAFFVSDFGEGWASPKILEYIKRFHIIARRNNLQMIVCTKRSAEIFLSPLIDIDNVWLVNELSTYALLEFNLERFRKPDEEIELSELYVPYLNGRFGATRVKSL